MSDPALHATFDTSDLDRVVAQLARHAPAVGADAARDAAESVAATARGRLPRRTGRLAASVGVEADAENEARVVVTAPYARYVEYGGRGHPHVPGGRYIGPSVEGSDRIFAESAVRGLDRVLR